MISAFIYLIVQSWRNNIVSRVKRLKQPKYLLGAIIGFAYFYFYFYRFAFNPRYFQAGGIFKLPPEFDGLGVPIAALILFVITVATSWILASDRASITFSEAEIAFLFPAPVKRAALIHYKLLKSQVSIFIMILFLTIFMGRFRAGGVAWIRAMGWWVILSTLGLHQVAASFVRQKLTDHGLTSWKRRGLLMGIVAALVVAVVIWVRQTIPAPPSFDTASLADRLDYFRSIMNSGPAYYILLPFRLVASPALQTTFPTFLMALWPALIVMALHYVWVMRCDVAFEEASIEASKRLADRVAAIRTNRGQFSLKPHKKKRPPFNLGSAGPPSIGFLWKNLIAAGNIFTIRLLFILIPLGVVAFINIKANPHGTNWMSIVGFVSYMALYISYIAGPQLMRQDFRQDVPMADLLKSYPLTGWQVALGELLGPITILTFVQWVLILTSMACTSNIFGQSIGFEWRISIGTSLFVLAPGLNLIFLIIPNASVLLFPGWFQTGNSAPRGIEATGQRIMFAVGQLLAIIVALIPAALVFAVIFFIINAFAGKFVAIPPAALGALVILLGEGALGLLWIGRLFERFDISAEGTSS